MAFQVAASFAVWGAQLQREVPLSLLWGVLVLAAALAAAAAVIVWVGRWVKKPSAQASDDLAHYRLLYERGEFSREEYERIRAKMGQRLRKELDLPAPPDARAPRPPDPAPPADTNIRIGMDAPPPPPPSDPPPA